MPPPLFPPVFPPGVSPDDLGFLITERTGYFVGIFEVRIVRREYSRAVKYIRALDEFLKSDSPHQEVVLRSLVHKKRIQDLLVELLTAKELYEPENSRGIADAVEIIQLSCRCLSQLLIQTSEYDDPSVEFAALMGLAEEIFELLWISRHHLFGGHQRSQSQILECESRSDSDISSQIPLATQQSVESLIRSIVTCLPNSRSEPGTEYFPCTAMRVVLYFWSRGFMPKESESPAGLIVVFFLNRRIGDEEGYAVFRDAMDEVEDARAMIRMCSRTLQDKNTLDEALNIFLYMVQIIVLRCPREVYCALHDPESCNDLWAKLLRSVVGACERQLCSGSPHDHCTRPGFTVLSMILNSRSVEDGRPTTYGPGMKHGNLAKLDLIPLIAHFTLRAVNNELDDCASTLCGVLRVHIFATTWPNGHLRRRLAAAGRRYIGPTLSALRNFTPQDAERRRNKMWMLREWEDFRIALGLSESDLRTAQDEASGPAVWANNVNERTGKMGTGNAANVGVKDSEAVNRL
ncbi:hypothetical protein NM688_g4076 [Phlebia brevispora]|uniref:Uncharacterized protein n=1 Tax=Phlebia brevispora TaxID=194682 RepID=A0ACC1T438_9APHY|nr:hypothetical protein NM688_g4076 [Phlebia brevispora]